MYEPGSFVPLAQAVREDTLALLDEPVYGDNYRQDEDPLWLPLPPAPPIDHMAWYQCDHLGTPQEVTDEKGEIAWAAEYRAWGVAREAIRKASGNTPITNPIRFQGQYHDLETGLHYNRYRYYDPEVGRFISKDPIGYAGGLNLFQYAPNPVEWIDPLGLHDVLASSDLVCRGGTCLASQFETGSGVAKGTNGKISGISTRAKPGASLGTLATPYRNGQVGVATVADIEASGGKITLDGRLNSSSGTHIANHATVDNLTPEQAKKLFGPAGENPVPKSQRGNICGLC